MVCLIPHGTDITADGNAIKVHNASGVSNAVLFDTTSYRYHLPFAPANSPWDSYLILCNYGLETVSARVFAGPSRIIRDRAANRGLISMGGDLQESQGLWTYGWKKICYGWKAIRILEWTSLFLKPNRVDSL